MPYELFRIIWVDSCGKDSWMAKEEAINRDLNIVSVGYLLSEDENSILISSHIGDEWVHSTMQIPRKAIISLEAITCLS
jgi:hypothetical protein